MDQTGFVLPCQTYMTMLEDLYKLSDKSNQKKIQAMLVSLDAERAFDSVRWKFLFNILEKFGFSQVIINTLKALYNEPSPKLKINRELTD